MTARVLPGVVIIAAAVIILPTPTAVQARVFQHLMSLAVQILAAGLAAVFAWRTRRALDEDRAGRVWQLVSLAMLSWTIGLLVYATAEWFGRRPVFPSAPDVFFVAALLAMGMALGQAISGVNPLRRVTRRQGLLLGGSAIIAWLALIRLHWPILASPLGPVERILQTLYSMAPALLLALGLADVLGHRDTDGASAWITVTGGVGCLSLANLGAAYLSWFGLYTDAHPINLLRVAGFAFIISGAGSYRRGTGFIAAPPPGIPQRRPVLPTAQATEVAASSVLADRPFLVSVGIGALLGGLVVLLVAGALNRARGVSPNATPAPPIQRRLEQVAATPAPVPKATPAETRPAATPIRTPGGSDPLRERYTSASKLLTEGRLREAQDGFLEILLLIPNDQNALKGLITVRRRMARNDPGTLRQQAAAYERAVATRTETEEHYTVQAMAVLARACALAANEIEAERPKP